ncbi:HAD-like protein [Boletus reticuloceps]|uniref:HAD-like protein n=1 Tax=Boletus reticuloceps TaxID=495285 RepID=A0A8I2YP25_9AGAM|nr:HAD-like protein [Boletus reticuloceps]
MASDSSMHACPRIEYVIFDMDGTGSHHLSQRSSHQGSPNRITDRHRIGVYPSNKYALPNIDDILAPHGVQMTWEIKAGLMGKVEQEASVQLLSFFPGIALTPEEYIAQRTIGQDRFWPAHKIPIVVATSSKRRNFLLKSAHLHQEIFGYFGCGVEGTEDMVVCGDDVSGKTSGKPEPYIFLYAAQEKLRRNVGDGEENVSLEHALERSRGLVFEDAIPGVEAGKRAGMSVVWVPDPNLLAMEYSGKHTPDETLRSIEEFRPEKWGLPPYDSIVRGVTGVKQVKHE